MTAYHANKIKSTLQNKLSNPLQAQQWTAGQFLSFFSNSTWVFPFQLWQSVGAAFFEWTGRWAQYVHLISATKQSCVRQTTFQIVSLLQVSSYWPCEIPATKITCPILTGHFCWAEHKHTQQKWVSLCLMLKALDVTHTAADKMGKTDTHFTRLVPYRCRKSFSTM